MSFFYFLLHNPFYPYFAQCIEGHLSLEWCGCDCLTCVASFPLIFGRRQALASPVQAFTPFSMRRGCFGGLLVLFVLPTSCIRNAPGDPGSSDCLTNSRPAITRVCECEWVSVSPVQRENYVVCDLPWTLNVSRLPLLPPCNRFSRGFPRFAIEISLWERVSKRLSWYFRAQNEKQKGEICMQLVTLGTCVLSPLAP